MITEEKLKQIFEYNPETGIFTRILRTANRHKVGDIGGTLNAQGYLVINIDGTIYYAHRLAFLYMTGKFPEELVDHIDTIKNNNSWFNLRKANKSENAQNQRKCQKSNKSTGLLGAYFSKQRNCFFSSIMIDNTTKYLGIFATAELAHEAYCKAKALLHPFETTILNQKEYGNGR